MPVFKITFSAMALAAVLWQFSPMTMLWITAAAIILGTIFVMGLGIATIYAALNRPR